MAQVRGTFPGNIDNVEKEVYTLIGTTLKAEPAKWRKYFRVLTSEGKSFERRQSYAMFGSIPLKGEGEDYSTALINPGPRKDFTHLEFGGGFEWTKTAQEDDRHDVLSEYATGLARAARFTEETYAAKLHNLATSTETTPDGVVAYSASHTLINGGTFRIPFALGNKVFHPYSDFLAHDIGTGDGIPVLPGPEYADTRVLIRTAPLWALRTRNRLMHDGLSFTKQEAIQRHDNQGAGARDRYNALTDAQKAQVLAFLDSL